MIDIRLDIVPPKHTGQGSLTILGKAGGRQWVGKKTSSPAKQTQLMFANEFRKYKTPDCPLEGPVFCGIYYGYPYRKSERRAVVASSKGIWCDKKPDADNLDKLIWDAMSMPVRKQKPEYHAGIWQDDSQVAIHFFSKFYCKDPFVRIIVKPLDEYVEDFKIEELLNV